MSPSSQAAGWRAPVSCRYRRGRERDRAHRGVIERWHAHLRGELPGGLDELLHDDVVFTRRSCPTPQEGKAITALYLQAAGRALPGGAAAAVDGGSVSGRAPTSVRPVPSATRRRC